MKDIFVSGGFFSGHILERLKTKSHWVGFADLKAQESGLADALRSPEIHTLTGIRAFSAWWVVAFHLAYVFSSPFAYWFARLGFLGVDLFFVLSGFIISYNYWAQLAKPSISAYRRFLCLRLARLYPVHVFTLLLSALLLFGVHVADISTTKNFSTWDISNFARNALLIHSWRPVYIESWNNASWSVSCEWFAYLIFPLFGFFRLHRLPTPAGIPFAVLLASLPAAVAQARWNIPCVLLFKVSCEFIAGCLIFHAFRRNGGPPSLRRAHSLGAIALVTGFVAMLWNEPTVSVDWIAVTFPLLILGIAQSTGAVGRVLGSKPAVYWGKVSYSLYMTHNVTLWPLKALAPIGETTTILHRTVLLTLYIIAVGTVAALTYHLIEEPARKWLRRRMERVSNAPSETADPVAESVGAAG